MSDPTPREIAVRDPLSEVTRNERRVLLGVSIIGIALVKTGLVPSKISALGIEFSQTDQKSFLLILALVALYFTAAFTVYAASDFIAWRLAFRGAVRAVYERKWQQDVERKRAKAAGQEWDDPKEFRRRLPTNRLLAYLSLPTMLIRATLEFLLPILVGVYAVFALWHAPPPGDQTRANVPISRSSSPLSLDSDTPFRFFP